MNISLLKHKVLAPIEQTVCQYSDDALRRLQPIGMQILLCTEKDLATIKDFI